MEKHPKLDIEVSNYGGVRTIPRDIMTQRGIRHYDGKVLGQFTQKPSKGRTCYKQVSISPTLLVDYMSLAIDSMLQGIIHRS